MLIPIFGLFVTAILLFASCELVGRISQEFNDICDMVDQFDWYRFPCEMQKILPIIMMSTQQPVEFECFGSIACNRETFKRVC